MQNSIAFPNLRRTSLALALTATLCGTAAIDARAAGPVANAPVTSPFVTVAKTTQLRQGDAVMGALPMSMPIHVAVALKLRNRDVLDAFIADNAKKQASGIKPQLMTSDQILVNHAPTQAQVEEVANYLAGCGFTHIVIARNRLLIEADGTAATARSAFMTTLAQVRTHVISPRRVREYR